MAKPGVMIYFGDAKVLNILTDEEAGILFRAIIAYAKDGILPAFSKGTDKMAVAWLYFQRAVDNDSERYSKVTMQKKYARYCGVQRSNGVNPVPYEEWLKLTDVDGCQRMLTDVTITNTNTSTSTNSSTSTSTSTSSNTSTNSKLSSNRKKDKKESPADILKAEYEAAFGGGPSDLSEWMYLCDNYSPDAIRKVMREAKERGMKREAAWAYVSTRVAFED